MDIPDDTQLFQGSIEEEEWRDFHKELIDLKNSNPANGEAIKRLARQWIIEAFGVNDGGECGYSVFSHLYWDYENYFSMVDFEKWTGHNKRTLIAHLQKISIEYTCPKCKQTKMEVEVKNRSSRMVVKLYSNESENIEYWCSQCKKEQQIARDLRRQQLHTMPYKEYLKTPEWIEHRTSKLKQANFHCELCFTKGRLNVHHKTYERRGYENMSDLIVLCADCHAKFHDKLPKE